MLSFKWRQFEKDIILLVVRWCISYSLSYRDIEEMLLERNVKVNHFTLNRWVIHYAPLLENKFRKKYKQKVGSSWRMDKTYIKIKDVWYYLYRTVDKGGNTITICFCSEPEIPVQVSITAENASIGISNDPPI